VDVRRAWTAVSKPGAWGPFRIRCAIAQEPRMIQNLQDLGPSGFNESAELKAGGVHARRRPDLAVSLGHAAHYGSLVFGVAILGRLGRHNWFFGDDWDFLVRRGVSGAELGLFAPHNEHWSTIPILIYRALYFFFGLRTYLPYFAVVLLLHVAAVHLVWRLLRRAGVDPWLSAVLAATLLVNGAGAENFMWSFQIGFIGALVFGLAALSLLNESETSRRRERLATGVAVMSLLWAGVAVPFVATGGILVAMRRGWRAALRFLVPPSMVYVAWLALVGHQGLQSHQMTGRGLLLVPSYVWKGLVTTVQGYTGLEGAGPVILLGLGYALLRREGWARSAAAAAPAAAVGALLLFLTIAPGRVALGIDQADAGRYHYLAWALLLPSIGVCLQHLAGPDTVKRAAVTLLSATCVVHGCDILLTASANLRERDDVDRRAVLAAAELAASGAPVLSVPPHRLFASDLRPPSRMVDLVRSGKLRIPRDLGTLDRLRAAVQMQVRLPPYAELPALDQPTLTAHTVVGAATTAFRAGCLTIQPQGARPEVALSVTAASGLRVTSAVGGELRLLLRAPRAATTTDLGIVVDLKPGVPSSIDIALTAAVPVLLLPASGETILCGVRASA